MTIERLKELFDWCGDNYEECDTLAIKHQTTTRQDLDALKLLDALTPAQPTYKSHAPALICSAEHDQIWFATDLEELAKAATEEQIKTLCGFGVRLDTTTESLSMFV